MKAAAATGTTTESLLEMPTSDRDQPRIGDLEIWQVARG
jgi:hypothetical protein